MKYFSTRSQKETYTLSDAIRMGLAPDGGLFIPEHFPIVDLSHFSPELSYPEFAKRLLQPFFEGDILEEALGDFCEKAFTFPLPLIPYDDKTLILELFHGPTASFKDFGARFLAECLNALSQAQKTTVIVATSGDTGSAVASAFYLKPHINVIVLFPKGLISKRQRQQITCWDQNILAMEVEGSFDDCQSMVKSAFQDAWFQKHLCLSSANSINIGRLLPQAVFYAYASVHCNDRYDTAPGILVPTGNLGNATSAYWAQNLGFPIREIALSTNANKSIPDFIRTGEFHPRPSIHTLANAMDVGNPSNFERLHDLFPKLDTFKSHVSAIAASDADIRKTIQTVFKTHKMTICPHTATAFFARAQLNDKLWIIAATADPSKFETIIEPLIQQSIPIPSTLEEMLKKPNLAHPIQSNLESLKKALPTSWLNK